MNKAQAIQYLYPNAINGVDFVVEDHGKGQVIPKKLWKIKKADGTAATIPTAAHLQTAYDAYLVEQERTAYQEQRAAEYPDLSDQIGALMKQMEHDRMANGKNLIQEMDDVLGDITAVKVKHPKPQ